MIYHKEFDENFLNYGIKKVDWASLFDPNTPHLHEWINTPIIDIFTDEGLKFFSDRNIKLRDTTRVFRLTPNFACAVHTDSDYHDAAFNFIVQGTSEMQWVSLEGAIESTGSYTQSNSVPGSFTLFNEYSQLNIEHTWTGKCALVRIDIPHRVVGGPNIRYAVSVRPTQDHFFNDLIHIL